MNKFAFIAIAMIVLAAINVNGARNKGGDIIVIGGQSGGMHDGMVLHSGGKKGGAIMYMGRRRRSVDDEQSNDGDDIYRFHRFAPSSQE
ncbi:hypothetical protein BLOT_014302 [Blomia tropicalis]|nr:hypothetical protein BLOT_014302 [Blomia tropicalis]